MGIRIWHSSTATIIAALAAALAGTNCPATIITVTTLSDSFTSDGKISLREALQAANSDTAILDAPAGSGIDTIQFDAGLFATGPGTIKMVGTEYPVTAGVNIVGPGRDTLTLDAQKLSRVFNSNTVGAAVQISGMTLRNGKVDVTGNGPNGSGGAIYNASAMTLNNVRLTGNEAKTNFIGGDTVQYGGGAIYNFRGSLTLQNAIVENNTTSRRGGGLESSGGTVVVQSSTFSGNTSGSDGPSISANDGTDLTLISTSVDNPISTLFFNTSPRHSKLTVTDSTLGQIKAYGNTSISRSTVGDMVIYETGTITDSKVGIISTSDYVNPANLNVTRSTVKQINQDYGNATIRSSTLTGLGPGGRALTASQGTTTLENVTVTGYQTTQNGTLYFANGDLATIRNSTIAGNHAGRGGGIFVATGTLNMDSTIVANNIADLISNDVSGFVRGQSNLVEDATGAFLLSSNNILGQDPKLDELAEHGGPTMTLALLPRSPAIDHGSNLAGLVYDQRGYFRAVDKIADIGALESTPGDTNFDGFVDRTDLGTVLAHYGQGGTLREGDVNGDGVIGFADFQVIELHFGLYAPNAPVFASEQSVPEPCLLALLPVIASSCGRRAKARLDDDMSQTSDPQPPRPNCPALLICQQIHTTPNRLFDILGMMNAFSITEFPADVTFAVHFALTEGQGDYRLALFLESPKFPEDPSASRHLLWEGDASLRSPSVVYEHPQQVRARFHAPGQCRIALYANGQQVARRPLSILRAKA